MEKKFKRAAICLFVPVILGLWLNPVVLLCLELHYSKTSLLHALQNVLQNRISFDGGMLEAELSALCPFLILGVFLILMDIKPFILKQNTSVILWMMVGGLLGILAFTVRAYVDYWTPYFTGDRISSTSVLALIWIPILGSFSMIPGLLAGWVVSLLPFGGMRAPS